MAKEIGLTQASRDEVDRLGWMFLASILETETERYPDNLDALAELGHVYTRQGRFDRGLAIDLKLVELCPDNPTVHYNLACSLALLREIEPSLSALESAVELGFAGARFMREDSDLENVRDEPRFQALLALVAERDESG